MIACLLLCLIQDQPTEIEIHALVEALPGSRERLLALGPGALRFLAQEKRTDAVADVMFELKCAGIAGELREKLEAESSLTTAPFPLAELDERFGRFAGIPIFVDFGLDKGRRDRLVVARPGRVERVLRDMLDPAGLEFAVARGWIVVSSPERLWSYPPEKIRALSQEEERGLRESIDRLDEAAILATGRSAVPYLEETLKGTGLESAIRARLIELIRRLQDRAKPAPFARTLGVECSASDLDAVRVRALREKSVDLKMEGTLAAAVGLAARSAGFEARVPDPVGREKVCARFEGVPALDVLYFLLASFDLDARWVDGELRIMPAR
ncbi:MAG: hypothetical protein HYY16_04055 [Planctomycetes bacterium]|nr:hypothetical protein [Planctomycetota bacterium]